MDSKRITQIGYPPDPKHKPLQLSSEHKKSILAEPKKILTTGPSASAELKSQKPVSDTPKRKLSVSTDGLSFKINQLSQTSPKKRQHLEQAKVHYHEFLKLDQAGPASIASSNTPECRLVAIKRSKVTKTPLPHFEDFTCNNVVRLEDIQLEGSEVRMVYEQMDVSLRVLNSMPNREWKAFEIAAVCKEVLAGLAFIHDCQLCYGGFESSTVMLDRNGQIKMANIGDCYLEQRRRTDEKERADLRSIGYMMVELVEVRTYMLDRQSIKLNHPEKWPDETGVRNFMESTQQTSRSGLSKHSFLDFNRDLRTCLKPHVFTALVTGSMDWEIP